MNRGTDLRVGAVKDSCSIIHSSTLVMPKLPSSTTVLDSCHGRALSELLRAISGNLSPPTRRWLRCTASRDSLNTWMTVGRPMNCVNWSWIISFTLLTLKVICILIFVGFPFVPFDAHLPRFVCSGHPGARAPELKAELKGDSCKSNISLILTCPHHHHLARSARLRCHFCC